MAEKLDPQIQLRVIDLAWEFMLQMKPVLPKSRYLEGAMSTRIEVFEKLYKALVKVITEPE